MTHGQSIEILETGQIYSTRKPIGTLLYINLFNHLPILIQISGVVERCCTSLNHCIPVRLLGGDFGTLKSHQNRTVTFFWPSTEWKHTNNYHFCQISLLFGPRNHMTHLKYINITINYLPRNRWMTTSTTNVYPKCEQFLNIKTNQCETLDNLRKNFSYNSSSLFIPFNHRYLPTKCIHGIQFNQCSCQENYMSIPIYQKLYHPKTYIHHLCTHLSNDQNFNLNLLIIITCILFILYIMIIIIISSLFICNYCRYFENQDRKKSFLKSNLLRRNQRFSFIEIPLQLQTKTNKNTTTTLY